VGSFRAAFALVSFGNESREKPRSRAGIPDRVDGQHQAVTWCDGKQRRRARRCKAIGSRREGKDSHRPLTPPSSQHPDRPADHGAWPGASLKATRCAGGFPPALTEAPPSAHTKACRLQGECRFACLTRGNGVLFGHPIRSITAALSALYVGIDGEIRGARVSRIKVSAVLPHLCKPANCFNPT